MRVYIAGPYTLGDRSENVRTAAAAMMRILDAGHEPFCPIVHSHFLDLMHPRPWEDWMRLDLAWLPFAEAVIRLPGKSEGADIECAAIAGTIPIFFSVEAFLEQV